MKTIQTQAEVFYSNNGNYGPYNQTWCMVMAGTVFGEATIGKAVSQLINLSGETGAFPRCRVCQTGNCISSMEQSYVIAVKLKSGGVAGDSMPDAWCVDSAGNNKSYTYLTGEYIESAIDSSDLSSVHCR